MSGRGFWDVVYDHPFGTFVITLAAIWSFERMVTAVATGRRKDRRDEPLIGPD